MTHGLGLLPPTYDGGVSLMERATCAVSADELPQRIDYLDKIPRNDQGPYNSCDGNAIDSALQGDHYLSTGIVVNTSARFSYLAAREKDAAMEGRSVSWVDSGATINGGILAARDYGAVLEADFPYWRFDWNDGTSEVFDITIPREVREKASLHRVGAVTEVLWEWADIMPIVGSGQACFTIGMRWNDWMRSYDGREPITRFPGGGAGGHALSLFEYEWVGGERWPRVRNSHGTGWGDRGTFVVKPSVFDRILKSAPWGARGLTQLPAFAKRKLDLIRDMA